MDTELIVVDQKMGMMIPPEEVIETARRAAKALQSVIAQKEHPVIINGEQYLEFEDLQLLGQFYGYTARTLEAKPVDIGGVRGAYARAELVEFGTGAVIGGAEAYCMADEERWTKKPWFQLASMAQTRAGSKALRNRLAWVAVLAGYKATPAEEMMDVADKVDTKKQSEHWCPVHNVAFRQFKKNDKTWYSHKDGDGWCNEDKLPENVKPKGNGKPTESPPADMGHKPASVDPNTTMWETWFGFVNQARELGLWTPFVAECGNRLGISFDKQNRPIGVNRDMMMQLSDAIRAAIEADKVQREANFARDTAGEQEGMGI